MATKPKNELYPPKENLCKMQHSGSFHMCYRCGYDAEWVIGYTEKGFGRWVCTGCHGVYTIKQFYKPWKKLGKKLGWKEYVRANDGLFG